MTFRPWVAFAVTGLVAAFALALPLRSTISATLRSLPDRVVDSSTTTVLVQGAERPRASDSFVDSIGVNVRLHYQESNYYARYDTFRDQLVASGIRHIRDALIDTAWPGYYQRLNELAHDGIHADLVTSISQSQALIRSFPTRLQPGVIDEIEAPNEYNTSGDPAWSTNIAAFQKALYSSVHQAAGASVGVIGPSLTLASAYGTLGNLEAYLDYGNSHPYLAGREPGTRGSGPADAFGTFGSLEWNLGISRQVSGKKPIIATETGYGDASVPLGVPPDVKARYIVRLFLEAWNAGVVRTYLYQFLDAGTDGFQTYGIVDDAMHPKPAYLALKNLVAQLNDPGPAFVLKPLSYTLSGPSRLHHTLLEKRNGTYELLLWLAVSSWDTGSRQPIATLSRPVTIAFTTGQRTVTASVFADTGEVAKRAVGTQQAVTLPIDGNLTILTIR